MIDVDKVQIVKSKDVDRIMITAERLGCEIPYPITVQQFIDSWRPNNQSQSFVIDDLDRIISMLARGYPIVTEAEIRLMEE